MPFSVIPEQSVDGVRVSSTYIRELIEDGDMETAARFLGHPHVLSGRVVHGKALGRTLGAPTANLRLQEGQAIPKFGVYVTQAFVDGKVYAAVTNVGCQPTVVGTEIMAEAWILDFEGDLYDKEITLAFYSFLRPEKKFPDLQTLRQEIYRDAEQARLFLQTTFTQSPLCNGGKCDIM